MNRNFNIVLVVVILGSLFAVGVNSFLHKLENTEQPPVGAGIQPVTNSGNNSDLRRAETILRQVGTDLRRAETSSLPGGSAYSISGRRAGVNMRGVGVSSLPSGSAYSISIVRVGSIGGVGSAGRVAASGIHLQSSATMHSVGGSGSMVDSRRSGYANYQLAGMGRGSNYAGSNYNSIGSDIYSSTSSLIAGNRTSAYPANSNYGGSTRAAAQRNINYPTSAGNTPQLYDMSAPVGGFNSLIGMNGLSALNSLNGADERNYTGSTRRFASGLSDEEWRQSYYNKYGSWPTDAQLAAYKELMVSGQVSEPSSSDIPTLDDEYWRNMFFMEYGYFPSDEQLEAYIKYKTETGSDTPPSSDIPTLDDDEWANMFFMEFGRFPTPEELEAYKNYKLGVVPVGDGMWLLLLLALVYALRKCFKGFRSLKCVR